MLQKSQAFYLSWAIPPWIPVAADAMPVVDAYLPHNFMLYIVISKKLAYLPILTCPFYFHQKNPLSFGLLARSPFSHRGTPSGPAASTLRLCASRPGGKPIGFLLENMGKDVSGWWLSPAPSGK